MEDWKERKSRVCVRVPFVQKTRLCLWSMMMPISLIGSFFVGIAGNIQGLLGREIKLFFY